MPRMGARPELLQGEVVPLFWGYARRGRGVVLFVRVIDGHLKKGDQITMMATDADGIALDVGFLTPDLSSKEGLENGQIGFIVTNLKTTRQAKVGDTVTLTEHQAEKPLDGYMEVKPFVYAGFFPETNEQYELLKDAIAKLSLSDASLQFTPENSSVLGFGVRIGFLGLLHTDHLRHPRGHPLPEHALRHHPDAERRGTHRRLHRRLRRGLRLQRAGADPEQHRRRRPRPRRRAAQREHHTDLAEHLLGQATTTTSWLLEQAAHYSTNDAVWTALNDAEANGLSIEILDPPNAGTYRILQVLPQTAGASRSCSSHPP